MVRYSGFLICFSFIIFLSVIELPDTVAQEKNPLLGKLQQKMANADLRGKARFAGQDRALICSYCHGEDGNSIKPEVPNLAGQNPTYLLEQIGRFASGERKDFVMNSLASKFTEEDQINLAIYYSGNMVKPGKFDKTKAALGKKAYLKHCQACHGKQGMGNIGYARLAGQKPAYIKMTLTRFRDHAMSQSKLNQRRSKVMEPIASQLSDQDIQNLAAYVASLQ